MAHQCRLNRCPHRGPRVVPLVVLQRVGHCRLGICSQGDWHVCDGIGHWPLGHQGRAG